MLDVREVAVTLDGYQVLIGHSLHVGRGEVVGLLGPSGSGKSTLLRVIAGIIRPDSGRVWIDGVDVTDVATHLRSVGMVFQDDQLFPHMSVADNIAFGLTMGGVRDPERSERVTEMLDVVGLPGFGARRVEGLSGGEAKRVALARSIAPAPKVLLLDEPLTGLDRELHDRLADEVATILSDSGITAVWVTHDRDEAETITDRIEQLTGD